MTPRLRRRPANRLPLSAAALGTLLALAACKEERHAAAAPSGDKALALATERAEQALRRSAAAGAAMRFRGVQAYAQAWPHRVAVCGQVNPFKDDPGVFVPFVSVLALPPGTGGAVAGQDDQHVATTPSEASRVWVAIVTYCYETGGPAPMDHGIVPLPPMPDVPAPAADAAGYAAPGASAAASPRPAPDAAAAQAGGTLPAARVPAADAAPLPPAQARAEAATPAGGSVTMRQNANLHADPHGPATRVVPQGTALRVFAQAPGGWLQVGEAEPWGWVHESMLEGR